MNAPRGERGSDKRAAAEFVASVHQRMVDDLGRCARALGELPVGFDVDDFAQHGLAVLLERYDRLPTESAAYNFAFETGRNHLLDALRKARRRQVPAWLADVADVHPPSGAASPHDAAVAAIRRAELRAALARLPERQRKAVILLYLEQFSRKEAARIMQTTQATVKSLAQRGAAGLREQLKGWFGLLPLPGCRRASRLGMATVPRLVLTVLCLSVMQQPAALRLPHADAYAQSTSDVPAQHGAASRFSSERAATGKDAAPLASNSRRPIAPSGPNQRSGGRRLPAPPQAGGCALDTTCVGQPYAGDRICLNTPQDQVPACANQDAVGVCPTINALAVPGTRCTRYSDPTLDP